jgi:hypothetical protein
MHEDHALSIVSSGQLGAAWDIAKPAGYSVQLEQPLRKSIPDTLKFVVPDLWNVILVLHSIGFIDWVQGKAYDAFWAYLRECAEPLLLKPRARIRITSSLVEEPVEVEIDGLSPENLATAELTVKETLTAHRKSLKIQVRVGRSDKH